MKSLLSSEYTSWMTLLLHDTCCQYNPFPLFMHAIMIIFMWKLKCYLLSWLFSSASIMWPPAVTYTRAASYNVKRGNKTSGRSLVGQTYPSLTVIVKGLISYTIIVKDENDSHMYKQFVHYSVVLLFCIPCFTDSRVCVCRPLQRFLFSKAVIINSIAFCVWDVETENIMIQWKHPPMTPKLLPVYIQVAFE